MSVLEMVDKKYLNGYGVEENIDDYYMDDYDYTSTKTKRKRKSRGKVDLVQLKEKILLYLVNLIIDNQINIVTDLDIDGDKNELLDLLNNYSLVDLFYIRRALKECIELGEISEEDFFEMIEVDNTNKLEGQLMLKFF